VLKYLNMATLLLVGKSFFRLRDYLEEHNYNYVTLLDKQATKAHRSDNTILCDFSSTESMIDTVKAIDKQYHINGVVAIYENYILAAAHIAKNLNLPGLPISAAEACTDKQLMRQLFAKAPEKISPEFKHVRDKNDLIEFANSHDFPLILKPANLAKSLLVTKANNEAELLEHYDHAINQIEDIYKKYAPNRTPKLLVEEFIDGSIHSVDAFIDQFGEVHVLKEVVDYETGQEIGYNDNFHYSRTLPSKLNERDVEAIRHCAVLGCRSLGMLSSPAHVEVILNKDGPRIVEIGARNGGYRERMYDLANGIDIVGNAISVALGNQPNIKAKYNYSCVTLELFPKNNGIFLDISNENELEKLPSVSYYSLKVKPGDFVGKSADGYKACAVIILYNRDSSRFEKDYSYVRNNVHVHT